jgi:anti-sigma factor RsiW
MIITCRELTEAATDKKEGTLDGVDRAALRVHLAWCTKCRRYLEQMDLTVDVLGAIPSEPAPEGLHDELLRRFQKRRPPDE